MRLLVPRTHSKSRLISCCGQKENLDVQDTERIAVVG